jgi:hypothetical protein
MDPTCCTPEQMALIGISAEQILTAFLAGFAAIIVPWSGAWLIGLGIAVVREA